MDEVHEIEFGVDENHSHGTICWKWRNSLAKIFIILILLGSSSLFAKEIALSFDDAPVDSSKHFESLERTRKLVDHLKVLEVPSVIVYANPCKRSDAKAVIAQLKMYRDNGHLIGNHTCSHPRLDDVGFEQFSADAAKGDELLADLFEGQKFFRFPYLNESNDPRLRGRMRDWLRENQYRNGMVSADNDDYIFSFKMNQAKRKGIKIDYEKIKEMFVKHVANSADYYDELAIKALGRSPKHVMLLHEMDATVMYIEPLVKELRRRGWRIISATEAYKDQIYFENPNNTYANNGIIAQLAMEKTGEKLGHTDFEEIKDGLDKILGL